MRRGIGRAVVFVSGLTLAGCSGPALPALQAPERHAAAALPVDHAKATAWISGYRREHGLPPLVHDPALDRVAQAQAEAMASADLLSHSVAGPLPDRLAVIGDRRQASAENVSAGYHDLEAALQGWRRSPPHEANLLYAPLRRIGIAAASASDTRYQTFWALVMTD